MTGWKLLKNLRKKLNWQHFLTKGAWIFKIIQKTARDLTLTAGYCGYCFFIGQQY